VDRVKVLLNDIQDNLHNRAIEFRNQNSYSVNNWEEFKESIENKGGFVRAHWDGTKETEEKIKKETKATIRCIELDATEEEGKCIYSGQPSKKKVVFAKAY
jgi:prolyl-tRNA synthetase